MFNCGQIILTFFINDTFDNINEFLPTVESHILVGVVPTVRQYVYQNSIAIC